MIDLQAVDKKRNFRGMTDAVKKVLAEKFSRVVAGIARDENGCINWPVEKFTYGVISAFGRHYGAHRVSFALHNDLDDSLVVAHKCDNKRCVNPEHLEAITLGQNARDALDRGLIKFPRGESCVAAKMTEKQVLAAFDEARKTGHGYRRIASRLGLPPSALKDALAGRSWRHLNGGKPVTKVDHFNARERRVSGFAIKVSLQTVLAKKSIQWLRVKRPNAAASKPRPIAELGLYPNLTGRISGCGTKWEADFESASLVGYRTIVVKFNGASA